MQYLRAICHELRPGSTTGRSPQGYTLEMSRMRQLGLGGAEYLFAYVQPVDATSNSSYAAELVTRAIQHVYLTSKDRSATALLERIMRTANTALWKWNCERSSADRHSAGATCVLVRPGKLYVAQVAPGQFHLCHQGSLVSIPSGSAGRPGSGGASNLAPGSLGLMPRHGGECQCLVAGPGDLLVIGAPVLGFLIRRSDVERGLLGIDGPDAAQLLYRRAEERGTEIGGGLVVELRADDGIVKSLPRNLQGPGRVVRTVSSSAANLLVDATRSFGPREPEGGPAASSKPSVPGSGRTGSRRAGGPDGSDARRGARRRQDSTSEAPAVRRKQKQTASGARGAKSNQVRMAQTQEAVLTATRRSTRRGKGPSGSTAVGLTALLAGGLVSGILVRLLPDSAYEGLRRKASRVVSSSWLPTGIALALLLGVALAWSATYIGEQRASGEVREVIARVDQLVEAAAGGDEAGARANLEEAKRQIDLAAGLDVGQETLAERRKLVEARLDDVNRVLRLTSIQTLLDMHSEVDGPSRLSQVVMVEGVIYLLDTAGGAVFEYNPTSRGLQKIMAEGWVVDNYPVEMPQQIGRRAGGLFLVDGSNTVYLFDPASRAWHRFALPGSEGWGTSRDVASFNGNLYVLSAIQNQILKYASGAFSESPERWIAEDVRVNLGQARGLAVDGLAYVLMADGDVLTMAEGKLEKKLEMDLYPELLSPVDIASTDGGSCIYIVDSYNRRVVVMTKDGSRQWQLLAPEDSTAFDDIRSVYVDEELRAIWIASGSHLLQSALPSGLPVRQVE